MIDQRFLDDLAQDFKLPPEETQPEIQLAAANTGVTTDGYQPPLYRLNMPKGLNTRENMAKQSVLLADSLAGNTKGAIQAFPGLPGDLESIGRMALNYLGYQVNENTVLPTSDDIGKKLESLLGPIIPKGQTTGVSTEERERVAKGGETLGEVISPGGQIKLASKVAKPVIAATKKIVELGKDLPVGMGIKAIDESLDPLGFYSAASKAVDNIQQPKGTGAQFLAQIEKTPGVKKEELLWTGLDEFLAGKKSVTKAEVQDYLKTNRVEVKEVTLGGGKSEYPYITADEWQGAISKAEKAKNFDEAERITAAWEDFDLGTGSTKFAKYQLPGGENYREVMLTLPVKESGASKISFKTTEDADNFLTDMSIQGYENLPYGRLNDTNVIQFDNAIPSNVMAFIRNNDGEIISGKSLAGSTYGSPHFEQPNILAHMRLNDRVDADGKKVLFVEEIQSDWHQAGRKKGYITGDPAKELDDYEKNLVTRTREAMKGNAIKDGLSEQEADAMATSIVRNTDFNGMVKYLDEVDKYTELFKKVRNKDKLVPDAPFKTSWHELSLKRAIQLASEGGYDRIAFTTGKTQAERYSLSKQVKELTATHYGGERYRVEATDINGKPAILKIVESEDELDNLIGKEFARKVIDETKGMTGAKTYSGLELDVGGEGMKGFYDTILPKYLDKYGKKWDAKVGTTKIRLATDAQDAADSKLLKDLGMDEGGQAAASVHYMDITPKMRESVLTKGQPLFQAAPVIPAGAAASQQEENK